MNSFDVVVCAGLIFASVIGFNAGFLRSVVTILGYLIAMPIAVCVISLMSPQIGSNPVATLVQNLLLFFGIFLVAGIVMGKVLQLAVDDVIGPQAGIGDRLAGAVLGAVRVGLVAVTLVLIFDRLVPSDLLPGYLTGSRLRPLLSLAGQAGFKSLPPDVVTYIDRLKRDRHI
jgi:membrane protein required for colicin V production